MLPIVRPQVPTMLQVSEQQQVLGPFRQRPPADRWLAIRIGRDFREAEVANMTLALRGSTHQEWSHIPLQSADPLGGAPIAGASRLGERVALHFTRAWLDRFLKPSKTDQASGRAACWPARSTPARTRHRSAAAPPARTGSTAPNGSPGCP